MIAKSIDHVPSQTDAHVNEEIRKRTEASIAFYSEHPQMIPQRLARLDREWDIERMLETGSSAISLFGLTMGLLRSRRWLILPLVVQGFFLQHALQGWAPPLPILAGSASARSKKSTANATASSVSSPNRAQCEARATTSE